MKRWLWQLHRALGQLGWQGMLGIALLVVAAVTAAVAIPYRLADLEGAATGLEQTRQQLNLTGSDARKRGNSREEQLARFYGFFPSLSTLPDWLEKIYAAAERNGVTLDSGEYKLIQERGWKLERYQIMLPVRGRYAQIRSFVAEVLTEVPASALDEIGFRRDSVGSTALDVRVRLTLYLGRT